MAQEDKIPPAGLHPRLVKKLLDNLESNDEFRAMFQASPEQALRSLGYTDPWSCMQLSAGATLASGDTIKSHRAKLEASLVGVQNLLCPAELQEGYSAE